MPGVIALAEGRQPLGYAISITPCPHGEYVKLATGHVNKESATYCRECSTEHFNAGFASIECKSRRRKTVVEQGGRTSALTLVTLADLAQHCQLWRHRLPQQRSVIKSDIPARLRSGRLPVASHVLLSTPPFHKQPSSNTLENSYFDLENLFTLIFVLLRFHRRSPA